TTAPETAGSTAGAEDSAQEGGGAEGEEVLVGNAVVQVVPKAGMINLFVTTDGADPDMAQIAEMLTAERPDLVSEYLQDGGDLMIVSTLEILPEYRGERMGYTVLHAIVETVGRSVDLVVVHAVPAASDGSPPEGSAEYEEAKATLKAYWQDFGFEEAAGEYLAFAKKSLLE
ncbi:MAG: hypothetical protein K0S72_385, partial [Arthrobacter sp.]|nr:hypothetical protein [Arthrobacter sp.]